MLRTGLIVLTAIGVMAAPALGSAQEPESGEFIALSYNVAGLPEILSGEEPSTNSPLISPLLNDYDLVLLQESWAEAADLFEGLPVFFYHHEIVAEANHPYQSEPAPPPLGTDLRQTPSLDDLGPQALNKLGPAIISDGLNRLSQFPFGPITRVMWEACYGSLYVTVLEEVLGALGLDGPIEELLGEEIDGGATDCAAQKGFSVATTELAPGVEVDIYNLHADAGGHAEDIAARADNFSQLADFIVEHSGGRAIILGGDTNLSTGASRADRRDADREVWDSFQGRTGLVDVCHLVDCGADDNVIDKFAVRSGGGVEIRPLSHSFEREKFQRGDGEPLSDHDALAVTFRWTTLAANQTAELDEDATSVTTASESSAALPATGGMGHAPAAALFLLAGSIAARLALSGLRPDLQKLRARSARGGRTPR